jgi:superfamily II DNA helicase RecQ
MLLPAMHHAALMQDQVAALQARGIAADYLASSRSSAERKALLARLDAAAPSAAAAGSAASGGVGALALLYVTPELLATDGCVDSAYEFSTWQEAQAVLAKQCTAL